MATADKDSNYMDQAAAWFTLITTAAQQSKRPLPHYLNAAAACVGVASALETLMPGFWERFASGVADDEEHMAQYAAEQTAEWLAGLKSRPTDQEIAQRFQEAVQEWKKLHASNLDIR